MEKKITVKPDSVSLKGTSLINGDNGPLSVVESNDGKITRILAYRYDRDGDPKKTLNRWEISARGKKFGPPDRSVLSFVGYGYKKRVYSNNRVRYPLKRVDWDPNGERHPENRGKSQYVRISWDEAAQIIADELLRIREKYGMSAVLAEADIHGEGKHVHCTHGMPNKLLGYLGGYTVQMRNFDSWEGWAWGAKNVWGCEPVGEMMPMANLYPDIAEHTDLLLFWGCDPETTPLGINGYMASRLCYWLTEIGLRSVYICPDLNYGACVHADKWIPVSPNTDAALHLAIAYMWITEGTYEKEYIASHSYGFEKFEDYVLGREDGVPKTPEWASEKCGVPVWTIKALARDWANKVTSVVHGNGGPMIRGPYSTEPARLEAMLLGMRGLGKPGVHQAKMIEWNLWNDHFALPYAGAIRPNVPGTGEAIRPASNSKDINTVGAGSEETMKKREEMLKADTPIARLLKRAPYAPAQFLPKCMIHDAILNGTCEWYGMSVFIGPAADQFVHYTFPAEGCSKIHAIWTDAPCMTTCWNDGNSFVEACRSEDIEFMVAQHPWLENDCLLADIILPICTKYELLDLGEDIGSGTYTSLFLEEPSCPPVGESLSDFWAVVKVAEKIDPNIAKALTGGLTTEEIVELFYHETGVEQVMDWEEFRQKKCYVVPCMAEEELKIAPGLRKFFEDPKNNPLTTPTGLLEFSSTDLEKHFPDDPERPPVAHWIESGETHDERVSSRRAEKYPLLCVSNHGRWRMHAQCDDITWNREVETMKVRAKDGYQYEPVWLHPSEAAKRGIAHGDIVKVCNERGTVLGGAYVTERLMPGCTYMDHGSRMDPISVGKIDRGGAINLITPHGNISKNATGMAVSSFLVEVEKVTDEEMAQWKRDYPEAFARKVDEACGLCLDGWMIK